MPRCDDARGAVMRVAIAIMNTNVTKVAIRIAIDDGGARDGLL